MILSQPSFSNTAPEGTPKQEQDMALGEAQNTAFESQGRNLQANHAFPFMTLQ